MFRLLPLARRGDVLADILLAGSLVLAGAAAFAGGVTLARAAAHRASLGVAGTVREEERTEEDMTHGVPTHQPQHQHQHQHQHHSYR